MPIQESLKTLQLVPQIQVDLGYVQTDQEKQFHHIVGGIKKFMATILCFVFPQEKLRPLLVEEVIAVDQLALAFYTVVQRKLTAPGKLQISGWMCSFYQIWENMSQSHLSKGLFKNASRIIHLFCVNILLQESILLFKISNRSCILKLRIFRSSLCN